MSNIGASPRIISDVSMVPHAILEAVALSKYYAVRRGFLGTNKRMLQAVDTVSLQLQHREALGLVGESGCGKSTMGRLLTGLIEPTAGQVRFDGVTLTGGGAAAWGPARRQMQIVFQDPYSSLNPRMTLQRIVAEPLVVHDMGVASERSERVARALARVGLGANYMRRYPHELSGGQRQRVAIARALILNPKVIIADEPVSALDVSIQAQVLNLLEELREEFKLSMLMISHNMAVVQHMCDRVAVMYLGRIVELAKTDDVLIEPRHPYTEALVSAVPVPGSGGRDRRKRIVLTGDLPSPEDPPAGCRFNTRCPHAQADCRAIAPVLREIRPGHAVACHHSEKIYGAV